MSKKFQEEFKIEEEYECTVNGESYVFYYPDPTARNGGKTFSGVAVVRKKDDLAFCFTIPFCAKAEEIDRVYTFKLLKE